MTSTRPLLTQNRELKKAGVWNWTLPALAARLSDGSTISTCPSAGACATVCYARNGTYRFPLVKAAHTRNLEKILGGLEEWQSTMTRELERPRYRPTGILRDNVAPDFDALDPWLKSWALGGGQAIRIHDAGDFFTDQYLVAWLQIARAHPDILFYAYTKAVTRMRQHAQLASPNFRWIYSMGGLEDHLVDKDQERHADVFPDLLTMTAAGYVDQSPNDLWAVTIASTRIGIPQNNIPAYRKRLAGRTFSTAETDRRIKES